MKFDLELEYALRVSPEPASQDVAITFTLSEPFQDVEREIVGAVMASLANVVNHGGLCRSPVSPTACSLTPATLEVRADLVRHGFTIAGAGPSTWRVILGLWAATCDRSLPVKRLEIGSQGKSTRKWLVAEEALAAPYPGPPDHLAFRVERSGAGSSTSDRLIQIKFAAPPAHEVVQEFRAALLAWDEVLWGGYPKPGDPPTECGTDALEAYLIDAQTLEHPMPNFVGDEDAFDAVLNIALWFHVRGHTIDSVFIE